MGNIKPGDYVIAADGKKAKVLDIFDKGEKEVKNRNYQWRGYSRLWRPYMGH